MPMWLASLIGLWLGCLSAGAGQLLGKLPKASNGTVRPVTHWVNSEVVESCDVIGFDSADRWLTCPRPES